MLADIRNGFGPIGRNAVCEFEPEEGFEAPFGDVTEALVEEVA